MGPYRVKLISHRGLLSGPDIKVENSPEQILYAISQGFDVELDVRCKNHKFYLGHDSPDYQVDIAFFNDNMWIHCKNLEAVCEMKNTNLNWFWHNSDMLTLTSKGFVWCYPQVYIEGGITVVKQGPEHLKENILGVCTDYPLEWRKFYKELQ